MLLAVLQGGFASLASYLAAHVLLCLVPAFFVAGALAALVPQASVVRFLGPNAPKWVAYPAAAGAGSLLAVCSCTVQPLFAGIYRQGAGLGPAITFLFFAPAANVLALSYTGVALGPDFATARVVLSLAFGIGIGMIMALLFHNDDVRRLAAAAAFAGGERIGRRVIVFLLALVGVLIAGTLRVDVLAARLIEFDVPFAGAARAQAVLDRLVPAQAASGEEGLTLHGVALIALLVGIGLAGLRGLGRVDEGFGAASKACLSLIAATLVFAALSVQATPDALNVAVTGRSVAVGLTLVAVYRVARGFERWDVQQWLWETWRFVRQIVPLLIVGVFLVGVVRVFIRPEWVQAVAGDNTVAGNLAGVVFGVFMYFPTLVEVPVAKMFLSLGMHPGPLLAYLMSDPELSLQSILITAAIIGKAKAWTYVALVALFSTAAGLAYGAWVDGGSRGVIVAAVALLVAAVVAALQFIDRRRAPASA
jgi:hypothetical protein